MSRLAVFKPDFGAFSRINTDRSGTAVRYEQQRKAQNAIYHNVGMRYGLSDTALWVLYILNETNRDCTQKDLIRQCFFAKQTLNPTVTCLAKKECLTLEMIPE